MYTNQQKRQHVYNLQTALRRLQLEENHPSPLVPDGIYGAQTTRAVRDYQRRYGLPVTGTVDSATWNSIFEQYNRLNAQDSPPQTIRFFPSGPNAALSVGDKGCAVLVLQCMLSTLSKHFSDMPLAPHSGEYDGDTAKAIYYLQGVSGLPQTGLTDRGTWDALASLHNAYYGRDPLSWQMEEQK